MPAALAGNPRYNGSVLGTGIIPIHWCEEATYGIITPERQ
jgi:hypothetical protein